MNIGSDMTTTQILVVSADDDGRSNLVRELGRDFSPVQARSRAEGLTVLKSQPGRVRVVLTDATLPDGDGRAFCADARNPRVPVVVVSTLDCEAEAIRTLDAGASDYIRLPIGMAELTARLRAHLRSVETDVDSALAIGRFAFHPGRMVMVDPATRKRIQLTPKETAILKLLYCAAGRPVSHALLLASVWGRDPLQEPRTHTLETHMYRLRQKLGTTQTRSKLIVSARGGYVLTQTA